MSAKPQAAKVAEADTAQLCRLFNLTPARIGQLAKGGVIFKSGRNKYDLWKSVRGYIEFLQRTRTSSTEGDANPKLRKITAEADLKEHELAVKRGDYVPAHEMDADGVRMGIVVASCFAKMADELAPLLAGRTAGEAKKVLAKYSREKRTELSLYESRIKIPADG
jgi:phage terminase Nu1 subunit (DNA packaging protein)